MSYNVGYMTWVLENGLKKIIRDSKGF